ncbi:hypothetical protein FNV62_09190 [Streptomyces sp. RLB3-17]|nr:hypothetical protein FNV61_09845 [Streptomyces sp. RLB3-6]QDO06671.1 hypothetical protein FNV68_10955 [Streptomyces sp. S1D4-23]QDO38285.1 hypothetical protein FNV62_09190 [Streptomyces sp. RLB3-17]
MHGRHPGGRLRPSGDAARLRHAANGGGRQGAARQGRPARPLHRDPRDARGAAGDRGGHRLWRCGEWGVELGDVLAVAIIPELESATDPERGHDSSTNALMRHYRTLKD